LILPMDRSMPTAYREPDNSVSRQLNGLVGDRFASRSIERRLFPLISLTFILTFSTGCTGWLDYFRNGFKVGPNYTPPVAPVACQWIDCANPNVISEPPKVDAWWQTFNDPVLDYLICTAYRQNLSLKEAGFRIVEARALRGIAVGELFPQSQQAFGSYTRTNNSLNSPNAGPNRFFDEWQTGASLAWELDFWGRFRRAVESADAHLDASIYNYDDVLVLLLSEVAQSYINIRTAEQRLEYARKNVENQQISLNLADVKFRNGATTKLDVTQGQSNLSQTQATIPPLEVNRRQAADQLCVLLGMPPCDLEAILCGRRPIPYAPPQVAVGIPADLIRRRPDILRAERNVAAQCALIGVAMSELYPHFIISGTMFYDASRFQDLFNVNSFAGNMGPSFQWNILNYGRLENNVLVQDARFQQLAFQYQNTVLQANAEAEDAIVGFLQFQQQVKYLATSAQAASESLGLVRDQYNAGKTDFNRVVNIEQLLTQQQDQLAVAQGAVANNLVLLYKALGGGWQTNFDAAATQSPAARQSGEPIPLPSPVVPPPNQPPMPLPPVNP
jgi:NodT family efflux transporter outer membrane factor (OMF) lipoprotein